MEESKELFWQFDEINFSIEGNLLVVTFNDGDNKISRMFNKNNALFIADVIIKHAQKLSDKN